MRAYFGQLVELGDNDWQVFSSRLVRRAFPKKTAILQIGEIENHLSFIEKGIVRHFIPGEDEDKDLTFAFAFQHAFVCAYDSFLTRSPSVYQLETLADSVLWRISFADLQYVYAVTEKGNAIGRFASEDLFLKKSKRELSLLSDTAEQRYLKLLTEQAHLLQQIPLKYLASYIGITPQALSRIRKRIS